MRHAWFRCMRPETAQPCLKPRQLSAVRVNDRTDTGSQAAAVSCPYCAGQMRWSPAGWLTLGVFECDRCGEFPDFRITRRAPAPDLLTLQAG